MPLKQFIKEEFSCPVSIFKCLLVFFIGVIYIFNDDICCYYNIPRSNEYWDMKFIFQHLLYVLMIQAIAITSNRYLRAISSIVLAWAVSDLLTLIFKHEILDIETRTSTDKVMIVVSFVLAIFSYYSNKTLYNKLKTFGTRFRV